MSQDNLLPDGTVCIHYVIPDINGKALVRPGMIGSGRIVVEGRRYRFACDPNADQLGGVPHTGDPRAATCWECKEAQEWHDAMAIQGAVRNKPDEAKTLPEPATITCPEYSI